MSAHPPILLDTLGMTDSLILMVMALVVFGPRRLPQIGRQIGKLMYEFRKASNDFKFQMEEELRNSEEADRRKKEEERQRLLATQTAAEQASVSADPPVTAPPVDSQSVPEAASGAVGTEDSVPQIMPPSTGETVAADPPARAVETAAESATQSGGSAASEQKPLNEDAEAVNQHG
jgi:sec-independent protein translocase protein TatB